MPVVLPAPLTVKDYRDLPEAGPRYQLIEGDLFMAPAPNRFHQDISRNIEFILVSYLKKHRSGVVYNAPFDVYLNDINVFQPDIVYISKRNSRVLTDAGVEGTPDFVVEILSPKTAKFDLEPKRHVYAKAGVEEMWIVDPVKQTVAVYRLREDSEKPRITLGVSDTYSTSVFEGLCFKIADFFAQED
jgi:Uma2 family endonuclease